MTASRRTRRTTKRRKLNLRVDDEELLADEIAEAVILTSLHKVAVAAPSTTLRGPRGCVVAKLVVFRSMGSDLG